MGDMKRWNINTYILRGYCLYLIISLRPEMMGVIYNYMRVDTDVFLSNPKHLEIVVTMCKKVYIYRVCTSTVSIFQEGY